MTPKIFDLEDYGRNSWKGDSSEENQHSVLGMSSLRHPVQVQGKDLARDLGVVSTRTVFKAMGLEMSSKGGSEMNQEEILA